MSEPLRVLPGAVLARWDTAAGDEAVPARERVINALVDRLEAAGHVAPTFRHAVLARERAHPTGLPTAVPCAIPHTDAEHVRTTGIAVATLARPVPFTQMGAPDQTVAARWVVMMCLRSASAQLEALQALINGMQDAGAVEQLLAAPDETALTEAVAAWLASHRSSGG